MFRNANWAVWSRNCGKKQVYRGIKSIIPLQETTATRAVDMGLPDKLVMERTGHRTMSALHSYQHPKEKSKEIVSDVIAGISKTHGEEVKSSLKRKMSRKRDDSDSNDDNNVDKTKLSKRKCVHNFANCNVVFVWNMLTIVCS